MSRVLRRRAEVRATDLWVCGSAVELYVPVALRLCAGPLVGKAQCFGRPALIKPTRVVWLGWRGWSSTGGRPLIHQGTWHWGGGLLERLVGAHATHSYDNPPPQRTASDAVDQLKAGHTIDMALDTSCIQPRPTTYNPLGGYKGGGIFRQGNFSGGISCFRLVPKSPPPKVSPQSGSFLAPWVGS